MGPKSAEVLKAFVRAAAQGLVDGDQYMCFPVQVLHVLIGGDKNSIDGAISHLADDGFLGFPVVPNRGPGGGYCEHDGWYYLTDVAGEWLLENNLIPRDVIGGLFPHTAGWERNDFFNTLPNWGKVWLADIQEWGKDLFPHDEAYVAARKVCSAETEKLMALYG